MGNNTSVPIIPRRNRDEQWTPQQVDQIFTLLGFREIGGYFIRKGQADINYRTRWLDSIAVYLSRMSPEAKSKHTGKWFTACGTCRSLKIHDGREKQTIPNGGCYDVHDAFVSVVGNEMSVTNTGYSLQHFP
jgi:hypothetical protein